VAKEQKGAEIMHFFFSFLKSLFSFLILSHDQTPKWHPNRIFIIDQIFKITFIKYIFDIYFTQIHIITMRIKLKRTTQYDVYQVLKTLHSGEIRTRETSKLHFQLTYFVFKSGP
jgi:hypothetical protein